MRRGILIGALVAVLLGAGGVFAAQNLTAITQLFNSYGSVVSVQLKASDVQLINKSVSVATNSSGTLYFKGTNSTGDYAANATYWFAYIAADGDWTPCTNATLGVPYHTLP